MNDGTEIHPDEAQLLLYLAGETGGHERRMIESRLANDAALRQQLDDLRRMESAVNQCLGAADAAEPIDKRLPAIERQAFRAIAQWQVDRLAPAAPLVAGARVRRAPVWIYPLSAAALVMICLGVWWLSLPSSPDGLLEGPIGMQSPPQMPLDVEQFDLALNDPGSETYSEMEREMATFQALNETLQ